MQVRARIFPYPVLNGNKSYSNYGEEEFKIDFTTSETPEAYILENITLDLGSSFLQKLFAENIVGVSLIVECSKTVFRKSFQLSNQPKKIVLRKTDFTERVDVSIFAYAKQNFTLSTNEVDDDYKGLDFKIEQYDIVAANDGFHLTFKHDETEGDLVRSIFSINVDHDIEENAPFEVDCELGRKISIYLSEKQYKNYKLIYTVPAYKEVFFNMFLVPSLIEGLAECQLSVKEGKELDEIEEIYSWFRSIRAGYFRLKGHSLEKDEFAAISPVKMAQELLGNPLGTALSSLVKEMSKDTEDDEND